MWGWGGGGALPPSPNRNAALVALPALTLILLLLAFFAAFYVASFSFVRGLVAVNTAVGVWFLAQAIHLLLLRPALYFLTIFTHFKVALVLYKPAPTSLNQDENGGGSVWHPHLFLYAHLFPGASSTLLPLDKCLPRDLALLALTPLHLLAQAWVEGVRREGEGEGDGRGEDHQNGGGGGGGSI